MNYRILLAALLTLAMWSMEWEPVGPGVDYLYHRYQNDNDIFILRVDRSNPHPWIDTMVAHERVRGARERTTSMYSRYDDSITIGESGTWDGTRYKAIGAVNGYYFDMQTGQWISGGISDGWYVHRFNSMVKRAGFGSGYSVKKDKSVYIGECVNHPASKNYVLFPKEGKTKFEIHAINANRGPESLVLYTPQYDVETPEASTGVEILVEVSGPVGISTPAKKSTGIVKEVRKAKGHTILPFDAVVISAAGKKADELLAFVSVGDSVEFFQDMNEFDEATCSKPIKDTWQGSFSALGGGYHFLKDGQRVIYKDTARNPRTAMAYNKQHIFYFVVDGRTSKSHGMRIDELSLFAKDFLGATDGIALDGGGSSTMVVNGRIKNFPSDGAERTVTNAVILAVPEPKEFSTKFATGHQVETTGEAEVYAGPGTNFHKITEIKKNEVGTIIAHKLDGVRAKKTFWWKVSCQGHVGWIDESKLKKK